MIPFDKPALRNECHAQIVVEIPDTKNAVQSGEFLIGYHASETFHPLVFDSAWISQDVKINAPGDRGKKLF